LFAAAAILIAFLIRLSLDSFLNDKFPNATMSWRPFWCVVWRVCSVRFDRRAGFFFVQLVFHFAEAQLPTKSGDSATMSMKPGYMFVTGSIIWFGWSMHLARRRADASAHQASAT